MKRFGGWGHPFAEHVQSIGQSIGQIPVHTEATEGPRVATLLDLSSIHDEHAEFVWLSLQRLGVRDDDIEDLLQEVFVVVHRRLNSFDGSARMTTWLFGICMRVVAAYRRRAFRRREQLAAQVPEQATNLGESPEEVAIAQQRRDRLRAILDALDLEKRAILVMYELDELPCEAIAEILGIPVGTVHSRLHAARKAFRAALARQEALDAKRAIPRGGP
jgi:RNA polymerase sigma-70 factor (ECF subfamily)